MPPVCSLARLLFASLAARAVQGSCGAALSCPAELQGSPSDDGAQDADVRLLQRTARLAAEPDKVTPPALARVMPIWWIHVPKCGSSFLNTLIHLPRVCDSSIPADLVLDTDWVFTFIDAFKATYHPERSCPGFMDTDFGHLGIEGHQGIEGSLGYSRGAGHFMTMLRDPEQRLISAYHDMVRAADSPECLMNPTRSWGGWATPELPTLPDFARQSRGCATKILTRPGYPCGSATPSDDEVAMAKRRLREGFAFVGITEQWDLSMCLFDAMFKTGCRSYQFHNTRPFHGQHDADEEYNTAQLQGVTDPYDGEVYAEAKRIFEENLLRYNVSEASCAACYRDAGLLAA